MPDEKKFIKYISKLIPSIKGLQKYFLQDYSLLSLVGRQGDENIVYVQIKPSKYDDNIYYKMNLVFHNEVFDEDVFKSSISVTKDEVESFINNS